MLWDKDSEQALFVRKLGRIKDESYATYSIWNLDQAMLCANIVICLIHQANYLLDQPVRQLEQAFLKEGGLSKKCQKARDWPVGTVDRSLMVTEKIRRISPIGPIVLFKPALTPSFPSFNRNSLPSLIPPVRPTPWRFRIRERPVFLRSASIRVSGFMGVQV